MTYLEAPPAVDVHVTGRRIVATIIDGIVLGAIFSGLREVFGLPPTARAGIFDVTGLSGRASLAWAVVVALYYIVLEGFFGRTVGKLVTGIKVIRESDGRVPGVGNAFLRTLLRLVDGFASYLVAMIVVVNSSRRRRLGDMAANTLVVRA
jgi:uncharacterized RDD family membrane protein YckC